MTRFVKFFYSGGASNSDPALSLGGLQSSIELGMRNAVYPFSGAELNTSGSVILVGAVGYGDVDGDVRGELVSSGSNQLTWSTDGVPVTNSPITINGDGRYHLRDSDGADSVLVVDVTQSLLPAGFSSTSVDVSGSDYNNLLPNPDENEALQGVVRYRCIYLESQDSAAKTLTIWFNPEVNEPDNVAIGFTTATGGSVETVISDEYTEPSGIIEWAIPTSFAEGLTVSMPAGSSVGLWVRQTIAPFTTYPSTQRYPVLEAILT